MMNGILLSSSQSKRGVLIKLVSSSIAQSAGHRAQSKKPWL